MFVPHPLPETLSPKNRLGLPLFAPGAQLAVPPLGHYVLSLPGLRRRQRQEAVLDWVINLLPGPSWAGLLSRLAVRGCVCARL